MENGEVLKLEEIEALASKFTTCPKCHSKEGFWLGVKHDHVYVQCKGCGASFELCEVFPIEEASKRLKFFRKLKKIM